MTNEPTYLSSKQGLISYAPINNRSGFAITQDNRILYYDYGGRVYQDLGEANTEQLQVLQRALAEVTAKFEQATSN